MKKRIISAISVLLIMAFTLSGLSITAGAIWVSPLAERGDVHNDGVLRVNDARIVLRCAVKIIKLKPPSKWPKNKVYGDVNGDKKVTVVDARIVLRRAIGLPDSDKIVYANDSEIFFSGKYYIVGKIVDGNEELPVDMAMDGSNFYSRLEFEGIDIAFMLIDKKITLINPLTKKYTQPSKAELEQLKLDVDKFIESIDFGSITEIPELIDTENNVTVDNVKYTCYTYKNKDGSYSKHYRVDTELCIIENYDADDALLSTMYIDSISSDTDSVFNLSSYTKTLFYIFILEFAKNMM